MRTIVSTMLMFAAPVASLRIASPAFLAGRASVAVRREVVRMPRRTLGVARVGSMAEGGGVGSPTVEGKAPVLITTPIYYVNDKPHIGHAYTSLACDVLARWKRLEGHPVHFLTGVDEHGQKVQEAAAKKGLEPQDFVDSLTSSFTGLGECLGLTNDFFVRTTSAQHKAAVTALWRRLESNGQIYLASYEGWYSVRDECYYTESELIDGKAPTGSEVVWQAKEPSYFFKLSEWERPLLDFYNAHPNFIAPESRKNEVVSFVKSGLRDLSISRTSFNWGVPIPDDTPTALAAEDGAGSGHVMYVWVDALANYISALGWGTEGEGSDALFQQFWPQKEGAKSKEGDDSASPEVIHVVGKDILRFHAVYWPALLMAAGLEPPQRLFAHGWWTKDGAKISKSVGNVIDPLELVQTFGIDQVRYFLLSEVPFGKDGDYSDVAMLACCNGFLANALGNLQMRVMSLVYKHCDGKVPLPEGWPDDADSISGQDPSSVTSTPEDVALLAAARNLAGGVREHMQSQALHKAAGEIDAVVRLGNKYIDEQAPWALAKSDPVRMRAVLWVLMDVMRHVAVVSSPLMPTSCAAMLDQLAVPVEERTLACLATHASDASNAPKPGTSIPKPTGLFPRIELEGHEDRQVATAAKAAADAARRENPAKKAPKEKKKKAAPVDMEALTAADPVLAQSLSDAGNQVRTLKADGAEKEVIAAAVAQLNALKSEAHALLASSNASTEVE